MIDINEVVTLLNNDVIVLPKYYDVWRLNSNRVTFYSKGIRPPYKVLRDGYNRSVVPSNWNTKYANIVNDYILTRHPQETDISYQFRLSSFTPIIQQLFTQAKNQISSCIFQENKYSITTGNESVNMYLKKGVFYGNSFNQWVALNLLPTMLDDANSFLIVFCKNNNSDVLVNGAMPTVLVVYSESIVSYVENKYLVFHYENKLYAITDSFQYEINKDKQGVYSIDVNSIIKHNFGSLPIVQSGGNWVHNSDGGYYESYFQPAIYWADLTMRNLSDHEVIVKNYSYPTKEVYMDSCNNCMASGKVYNTEKECEETCKTCNGIGKMSINPGEHVVKQAPSRSVDFVPYNAVTYSNPDVAILQQSDEHWNKFLLQTMLALYIEPKQQGGGESAISKELDRQKFYMFCSVISQRLFYVVRGLLKYIAAYLVVQRDSSGEIYYDTAVSINVKEPTHFKIPDLQNTLEEYKSILKDGTGRGLKNAAEIELAKAQYGEDSIYVKKIIILSIYDSLYGYLPTEISAFAAVGGVSIEDAIKHAKSSSVLDNIILVKTEEWFFGASKLEIIQELTSAMLPYIKINNTIQPLN